jgi:hypothetical protein
MKTCPQCGKEIENHRKAYCSQSCQFWFNSIRREKESHLPPVKRRNAGYFHLITGSTWAKSKGQGKRMGSLVVGSMAAMVSVYTEEIVPFTEENLKRHFFGTRFSIAHVRICDGSTLNIVQVAKKFGWPESLYHHLVTSQMIEFNPEPTEALRNRFTVAIKEVYNITASIEVEQDRSGAKKENIFDFEQGVRLIVSRERFEEKEMIHFSASYDSKYYKGTADRTLFDLMTQCICDLCHSQIKLVFSGFSTNGIPHWHIPLNNINLN